MEQKLHWQRRRRVQSRRVRSFLLWTLTFPRGAASPVHVRHHVVQHVGQRVFYHGSPAHVTHLRWGKKKAKNINLHPQRSKLYVGDIQRSEVEGRQDVLTGWYLRSFGGCLKCGPKLTETWKRMCVKTWTYMKVRKKKPCDSLCSSCTGRLLGSRVLQTDPHRQRLGSLHF